MSQIEINFDVILPLSVSGELKDAIVRIEDKSYYDHNYYMLPTYGDWIDYGYPQNNVLYEEYDECFNSYSYTFGRFENDKFIRAFGYCTQDDCLDNVKTINMTLEKAKEFMKYR